MIRPSLTKNRQNNSISNLVSAGTATPPASTPKDTRLLGELLRQLLDRKSHLTTIEDYDQPDYDLSVTKNVTEANSDELLQIELDGTIYQLTITTWPHLPQQEPISPKDPYHDYRSLNALSPREHEIVRLVARGLPNKAIASVLDISSWTVATHLRRIFAKLEVTTRAAMVARAAEAGLLTP